MSISSPGIGSNLDVNGLISKLMAAEQQPIVALNRKEASYQAKLTGFGTLKGAISQFQTSVSALSDISKFQAVRGSTADASVASVSASTSAAAGSYSLEVSKLAQSQKLAAVGQASATSAISNGVITFDFGTVDLGPTGSFDPVTGKYSGAGRTFTSNGAGIKTVTIDATNNSLSGIRDAINKANVGVTATIVNDGGTSPYRLALSSTGTGKNNSLKMSVVDDAPGTSTALSTLLNHDPANAQALAETQTAQNAEFKIDGIAISKASNTVSDAISGVTLTLLKTNVASATTVTVARDTASISTAVNAFVKSYNEISKTLKDAVAFNSETKASAILNGESSLRSIETQIRGVLNAPVVGGTNSFTNLSKIGITLEKDGTMTLNSAKLQSAIDSNFGDFAGLFAVAGKSSDSLVAYSGVTDKTSPGAYAVNVTQLATKGSTTASGAPTSLLIDASNDTLDVQIDGKTATIKLGQATYASAATLAAEIQTKINGVAAFASEGSSVAVTSTGGILSITSNKYGSVSTANITAGNGAANLNLGTGVAGLDVAGTINGTAAVGLGQVLTGAKNNAAEGIKLTVTGGSLGDRGTVNYSQGYAAQFNKLTTTFLASDGLISARTNGLNASLKSLTKSRELANANLVQIEKRYRIQFGSLDTMLSKMTSTSNFLTQQLASLSK
ncbi:flagellar filament capping protein FliD [Undibacterium parvum]|uniref:Flagellar hook-associated protein 2 n=1 Tax=Undibacterium parvum TaxID=401471 RepID=A0A3Q9BTP8_9BURK|nr:flagellar filament capping protein FliD [Undibacterium parvum]AZP13902.1 flagellar hook protein FliD [Undibacterium parvum]